MIVLPFNRREKTRIHVVKGDLTKMKVEAIVNAANPSLLGGSGVDGAIHRAAGEELLRECQTLGGCKTGQAKITKGYLLPAKYVIHTVGPIWQGGQNNEAELLEVCYANSIKLAVENNIKTLAFPAISTGAYGYPLKEATAIAFKTITNRLFFYPDDILQKVYLVCFDRLTYQCYLDFWKYY